MDSLTKNARKFDVSVKSAPQMTNDAQRQKIVNKGLAVSYIVQKVDY